MDDPGVLGASPEALTDKNLYIYCDNNPVMRVDEDGEFWNILIGAGFGAIAGKLGGAGTATKYVSNHFWRMVKSGGAICHIICLK